MNRNVLFTCLGSPTKPIYDLSGPVLLEQGDRILLCSDGLWGALDDDAIVRGLGRQAVSNAVPDLVEDALRAAGDTSDNVTVVAMEWETPDAFESTQGVSTESISDDVFESTIRPNPSTASWTTWTTRPSSAPSPRSTKPSAALLPKNREPPPGPFAERHP